MNQNQQHYAQMAATIPVEQLVGIVARQATQDRVFAERLRAFTSRLDPPSADELTTVRNLINEAASIPNSSYMWDLHHIVRAGQNLIPELEVLAARPANNGMLALVEYAAEVWDELAGYLYDAWETYDTEPDEIGSALREIHVQVCEELKPDPIELAERLARLANKVEFQSCLDDSEAYADVLGTDGLAELARRTGRAQ